MGNLNDTKNQLLSKIDAVKKINDDPSILADSVQNKYLKDLTSSNPLSGRKLGNTSPKTQNSNDIFSELLGISDSFVGTSNKGAKSSDKLTSKNKLKQYATKSVEKTLSFSKQIVLDNVQKVFFAGNGICGNNTTITGDTINIKPSEIDFLNMLTLDPSTPSGQIMYEPTTSVSGKIKINRNLYTSFGGVPYHVTSINNNELFTSTWNSTTQEFKITGLTQGGSIIKVSEFLSDYYSSIEFPDISGITKTAMLMTLQGDGTESTSFNFGMNNLDRLTSKLCAICGNPTNTSNLSNQNATDLTNETDEDISSYFNFDDVEGISLDDEDLRHRRVLRFTDCNNFEVPVNPVIIEGFTYMSNKKNLNDLVASTLSMAATDAYVQSGSNIPLETFNLFLLTSLIKNLPKALISSVLSPKMILPVLVIYKMFKSSTTIDVKDLMKQLSRLFYGIVKDLFWIFIQTFWTFIKIDLMALILKMVNKILKNKYKRYLIIITTLIALLTKILQSNINSCQDLYGTILTTINTSLSTGGSFKLPGTLLTLSDSLPGYSQDRAFLNIIERIEASGIPMGPINGEPNNLSSVIKSIIDGHTEEMDLHSFVKVSNKAMVLASPSGPVVVPPGLLNSVGKMM